jgi:hypothetical protein
MSRQKCHCNGSRGTDCDYCGGSGYANPRKKKFINVPPIKPPPEPEPKRPQQSENTGPIIRKRQTYDHRIIELASSLREITNNAPEETIIYLGKRIRNLYEDLKALEKKVKPKQRKHYNQVLKASKELIFSYDTKFVEHRLLEDTMLTYQQQTSAGTFSAKFKDLFEKLKSNLKKK